MLHRKLEEIIHNKKRGLKVISMKLMWSWSITKGKPSLVLSPKVKRKPGTNLSRVSLSF